MRIYKSTPKNHTSCLLSNNIKLNKSHLSKSSIQHQHVRNLHLSTAVASVFSDVPRPEYRFIKNYSSFENLNNIASWQNDKHPNDAILCFNETLALQRMEWREILRNLYAMQNPQIAHFNIALHALNRVRRPVHANSVLEHMRRKDVTPDIVTIEQGLLVLSGGRYPIPAMLLFHFAEEKGIASTWMANQYIRCICRHRSAYDEIQRLEEKGHEFDPDVLSKVVTFSKEMRPSRLVSFYRKHRHLPLSSDAFHTILSATSQIGDSILARHILRDIQRASAREGRTMSPDVWVALLVTFSHGNPPPDAAEFNHVRSLVAAKVDDGELDKRFEDKEEDEDDDEDDDDDDNDDNIHEEKSSSYTKDNERIRKYRTAVLRGLYRTGQRRAFAEAVASLPETSYYTNQVLAIYAEGKDWDRFDSRLDKMRNGELPPPTLGSFRMAVQTQTERGQPWEGVDFWWQHVFPAMNTQRHPRRVLEVGLEAAMAVPELEQREKLCIEMIEEVRNVVPVWVSPLTLEKVAETPGCGGKDGKVYQLLQNLDQSARKDSTGDRANQWSTPGNAKRKGKEEEEEEEMEEEEEGEEEM